MDFCTEEFEDVEYELTEPQSEYFEATEEYVAVVAGMGSGKTQTTALKIMNSVFEYPSMDYAYLAPSYALIRDIFYPKITELLDSVSIAYKINKSEHTIYIEDHGRIYCRTMDNPEMIVGWECGDAFMDEFDVLATDKARIAMNKVTARCRQKFPDGKVNQKFVSTTPEGYKATYEFFVRKPLTNSRMIQMSTRSNAHNLPANYIQSMYDQYPPELVDAYVEGKFVNLKAGRVYAHFDRRVHCTNERIVAGEQLHIGQDFNSGGCVSSVFVVRSGAAYLLDSVVSIDTAAIVTNVRQKYKGHFITFYPDSSGKNNHSNSSKSDIDIIRNAGFNVVVNNSNPFIRDRVNCVNSAFSRSKLFVNLHSCSMHVEALEQQAYDPKNGMPEKFTGAATVDDYNDSLGYFVIKQFPIILPSFSNKQY
jgi:PBSX family phage terminase large subunit